MQPARCRWSCRGTRRPRKLRSCLDRVAIDPHRSRASIRLLPCAPHLPPPSLLALLSSPPRLASPSRAAPQENGKIQADTGPRRQTTTFSRKRPGSRIRSDDRSLPCKTGWWSFLWNSANRTCVYIYVCMYVCISVYLLYISLVQGGWIDVLSIWDFGYFRAACF